MIKIENTIINNTKEINSFFITDTASICFTFKHDPNLIIPFENKELAIKYLNCIEKELRREKLFRNIDFLLIATILNALFALFALWLTIVN